MDCFKAATRQRSPRWRYVCPSMCPGKQKKNTYVMWLLHERVAFQCCKAMVSIQKS